MRVIFLHKWLDLNHLFRHFFKHHTSGEREKKSWFLELYVGKSSPSSLDITGISHPGVLCYLLDICIPSGSDSWWIWLIRNYNRWQERIGPKQGFVDGHPDGAIQQVIRSCSKHPSYQRIAPFSVYRTNKARCKNWNSSSERELCCRKPETPVCKIFICEWGDQSSNLWPEAARKSIRGHFSYFSSMESTWCILKQHCFVLELTDLINVCFTEGEFLQLHKL